MAESDISTIVKEVPPHVEVPQIGLGTMRPAGAYIVMLLQLERPCDRVSILAQVAKDLGISLQEFSDEYLDKACSECGVSLLYHKQIGGVCP